MNITITINCDNDAFARQSCGLEVGRILKDLHRAFLYCGDKEEVSREMDDKRLMDANGNTVGRVEVSE